jgi:hypothetical protein
MVIGCPRLATLPRLGLMLTLLFSLQAREAHFISASSDANGNRPGTASIQGLTTITCLSAMQSASIKRDAPRPTCFLEGPGLGSQVQVGVSVSTSGKGTVTLTCKGQGRLSCSAQIND